MNKPTYSITKDELEAMGCGFFFLGVLLTTLVMVAFALLTVN